MQRMQFEFGSGPWSGEPAALQVYLPVALEHPWNWPLRELLGRWRASLREVNAPVTLIGDDQLHVTLDVISDAFADEISEDERAELSAALRRRFADWPAQIVRAGSALAYPSGVILDLSPSGPIEAMAAAVRETLVQVRGLDAAGYRQPKPHVSVGYSYGSMDSDPVQRALRKVDPAGAEVVLDELALVEVTADPEVARLHWQRAASLPLPLRNGNPKGSSMNIAFDQDGIIVDGARYDRHSAEDREKLRELGFSVSDDGTTVHTPRSGPGGKVNVVRGNASNIIQAGDIDGGITFG